MLCAAPFLAASRRSAWFSFFSRAFSDLAWKRSPVHPAASWNGRATRFAATSNGRSTDAPKLCTGSSVSERNDSVISTSESTTRHPTTILRRRALERVEE